MEILENFKGYLQTDGYVAYDVFDKKPNITLINCMAHARRNNSHSEGLLLVKWGQSF